MSGLDRLDGPISLQDSEKKLDLGLCSPSQAGFTLASINRFFPMNVGTQWEYEGEEEEGTLRLLVTVLDETRVVDGVTTRVIEEREFLDDELFEVSWNYHATRPDGTVCYFGEDVDIFEDGEIVHDGAWCSQDNPDVNKPGIFMPADPQPGMKFQAEVAPGVAEDEVKIIGQGKVTVPFGSFTETIRFREFNPLDGEKDYKVYAAGVGLIIDGVAELLSFTLNGEDPGDPISEQACGG
ncbi:MAG: hypothetical protein H0U86_05100 [Chloroflexi bacterium]|nr:hypothetical protein [Chloroflexota bacterium]